MPNIADDIINAYRTRESDIQKRPGIELGNLGALQGLLMKGQEAELMPIKGQLLKAQLAKILQEQKMTEQLMGGGGMEKMSPDQLDLLGQKLAMGGHPGASTVMSIADKRRQAIEQQNQIPMLQSQPQGLPAGATVGNQQTTQSIPADEVAAYMKVVSGQVKSATPEAGDPQMRGGGAFAPLIDSQSPAISARAKQLQMMVDDPRFRGSPAQIQKEVDNLTKMDATFQQQKSMLAQKQGNTIEIKNMFPPQPKAAASNYATQGSLDPVEDKDTINNLATEALYDPNALMGFRRDTKAMGHIMRARTELMKEAGITAQDVVSGRAGFKADTLSLNKITPQYDAIVAFEKTAIRNGEILKTLADKVDTTGVPALERWIRAGRKSVAGDADVAKLDAQMQIYRTEAARILTNPNLTGQLTDSARHEVEGFLSGGSSAGQIREVVDLLKRDFDNRKQTLEEQIGSIRARMRGRVAPSGETPPPTPATPVAPIDIEERLKKYK